MLFAVADLSRWTSCETPVLALLLLPLHLAALFFFVFERSIAVRW